MPRSTERAERTPAMVLMPSPTHPVSARATLARALLAVCTILSPLAASHAPTPAQAPSPATAPAHHCEAPMIPPQIANQVIADHVRGQVDAYKQCIQDFANAQQALAERHNKAANDAIAEFNQFVKTRLPAQ